MVDGITGSMDMSLSKLWKMVKDRKPGVLQSMESQKVGYMICLYFSITLCTLLFAIDFVSV